MKYVKPKSLTWWVGAVLIVSGVLELNGAEIPYVSATIRPLIEHFFGSGAGERIFAGLALWGIRAAPGMQAPSVKVVHREPSLRTFL